MREQKIKGRRKIVRWRYLRILSKIPWLAAFFALGWMSIWARERLRQPSFLPMRGFVFKTAASNHDLLPANILSELKTSVMKKNRLYCLFKSRRLVQALLEKYSFIESTRLDYFSLIFKGKAEFLVTLRKPAAFFEDNGRFLCLDRKGHPFLCPSQFSSEGLIKVKNLEGQSFEETLKSLGKLEAILGDERVLEIESIADRVIAFKTGERKIYKFAKKDVLQSRLFGKNLGQLTRVLKDLFHRNENFSYIDLTLWDRGIVGG